MFDNFVLGPLLIMTSVQPFQFHVNNMEPQGYYCNYVMTRGDLFDEIKSTLLPEHKLIYRGVIFCHGFIKPYEE